MRKNNSSSKRSFGFTLFEMLTSVAIILVVSSIVFFNHSKFKSDTELVNFAYRLALAVREAQVYSISVKQFNVSGVQNFNTPYGLHFKQGVENSFIFFADAQVVDPVTGATDGVYTAPEGEDELCTTDDDSECVEKTTIGQGILIKGWCGIYWGGAVARQRCISSADDDEHFLDISFRRPNPDAVFRLYETYYESLSQIGNVCEDYSGTSVACTGWALCLVAPGGRQKQVVVYETGQISVQNVDEGSGEGCDSI